MNTRLISASVLTLALLMPSTSWAQAASPEYQASQSFGSLVTDTPSAGEVQDSGEIVITGSRIKRAGFASLEPTSIVSGQYMSDRGITNVADALNEQPGFGIPQNAEGGQSTYGVSQNFVNKFGLGTARTLTLVNGRRFVSTNAPTVLGNPAGLQVDLNVINPLMIERIENVAIGGAPIYGSDAIAGTINVILKKDYEGVEFSGLSGISNQGDNFRAKLSGIAGFKFGSEGRGHVLIGGSWDRSDGLRATDRDRAAAALSFQTNPTAGSAQTRIPGRTPPMAGRINTR